MMENALYVLTVATWALFISQKPVAKTDDWFEAATHLIQIVLMVFLVVYIRDIVSAVVYVMTNTWCAIVYPFTQVCKG